VVNLEQSGHRKYWLFRCFWHAGQEVTRIWIRPKFYTGPYVCLCCTESISTAVCISTMFTDVGQASATAKAFLRHKPSITMANTSSSVLIITAVRSPGQVGLTRHGWWKVTRSPCNSRSIGDHVSICVSWKISGSR